MFMDDQGAEDVQKKVRKNQEERGAIHEKENEKKKDREGYHANKLT